MHHDDSIMLEITPQVLLKAYACGIFPMAESSESTSFHWIEPKLRGIIPLEQIHFSRRLRKLIRSDKFSIRTDSNFDATIEGCAARRIGRENTWINKPIRKLYRDLFTRGYCHTVEVWRDNQLVGGLYGISLAGAFFGESMFSIERDTSKVALAHLSARLIFGGYNLLDAQFHTKHLSQFGAIEISKKKYSNLLDKALQTTGDFHKMKAGVTGTEILEIVDGFAAESQPNLFKIGNNRS